MELAAKCVTSDQAFSIFLYAKALT